tara:strand:+ start:277 stop:456 length:180 start_codon:yes stop_codon:yes gene_type:complete
MKISKGEMLIELIAGEVLIDPALLMSDNKFDKEVRRLIKNKLPFIEVKNKMVEWCNNQY